MMFTVPSSAWGAGSGEQSAVSREAGELVIEISRQKAEGRCFVFECQKFSLTSVFCLLSSCLILSSSLAANVALAAASSPYRQMQEVTRREFLLNTDARTYADTKADVEAPVKKFAAAVAPVSSGPDDVVNALRGDRRTPCYDKQLDAFGGCDAYVDELASLARREERVRTLGRDLQIIATSYETAVTSIGSSEINVPLRAQGIRNVWRSSTDNVKAGDTAIQYRDFPDTLTTPIGSIATVLQPLALNDDREAFTAAVWRYQFGARYATRDRKDLAYPPLRGPADNPELQLQTIHWKALEGILTGLYTTRVPDGDTLKKGEMIVYRPTPAQQDQLDPYGITVWAYVEKLPDGTVTGDAGLQWTMPVEPVLPALCQPDATGDPTGDCQPIKGGFYPPAPDDGRGLCTLPFGRLGYLCRDILAADSADICTQNPTPDPDKILLTACTQKAEPTQTASGPDVCGGSQWIQNPPGSPANPLNAQSQCRVNIVCANTCPVDPTKNMPAQARTFLKSADGTITVCINQNPNRTTFPHVLPHRYAIIHELTHAQQSCGLPPGTPLTSGPPQKQNAEYCRTEREAYVAMCHYAIADKAFIRLNTTADGTTTEVPQTLQGTDINTTLCADILTDHFARTNGFGRCSSSFTYRMTDASVKGMANTLMDLMYDGAKGKNGAIESCKDALNRPEVLAQKRATEQIGRSVCDPNRTVSYLNTIGNNACYIGSCIEDSLEHSRMVPGRIPVTAGDEAFPWDACMAPRLDGGQIRTVSAAVPSRFPAYRPGLLIKQLDTALCQSNGLSASTPPLVCAFDVRRRLLNPLTNPLETVVSLTTQSQEQQDAAHGIQQMSRAVGARMGIALYDDYLRHSTSTLSDLTVSAATLLETFARTTFSRQMCPLNAAAPDALLASPFCQTATP